MNILFRIKESLLSVAVLLNLLFRTFFMRKSGLLPVVSIDDATSVQCNRPGNDYSHFIELVGACKGGLRSNLFTKTKNYAEMKDISRNHHLDVRHHLDEFNKLTNDLDKRNYVRLAVEWDLSKSIPVITA